MRPFTFEPLEVRRVLSAANGVFFDALVNDKSGDSKQVVGPLAPSGELFPEVEQAFKRVSQLDQYSQEQLENTRRWAIHTAFEIAGPLLASATGVPSLEVFSGITNTFIYYPGEGESADDVVSYFANSEYVDYFYPLVPLEIELLAVAPRSPDDPMFGQQWHLESTGQEVGSILDAPIFAAWGEDIRVTPVWNSGITGEGVVIGIVDDGLDILHPDLSANVSLELSEDFDGGDLNPSPDPTPALNQSHGTAVAGVAAGKGNNGKGITGVAFDATLAGIRLISRPPTDPTVIDPLLDDMTAFDALTHLNDQIDIYNNSWGYGNGTRTRIEPIPDMPQMGMPLPPIPPLQAGPMVLQALRANAFTGREGLGNVQIFAAGNDGDAAALSNFRNMQNSRFVVTVGAYGQNGRIADYSEGGANVLVVAPSAPNATQGGLVTTDLLGEIGANRTGFLDDIGGADLLEDLDYRSFFNGTSAAAPVVSGVVALMLQANPNLSYRDVQHILVQSSRKIHGGDGGWLANRDMIFTDFDPAVMPPDNMNFRPGDGYTAVVPPPRVTNGSGLQVHDSGIYTYGHGAVDARLAVELAKTWRPVTRELQTSTSLLVGVVPPMEVAQNNAQIPGGIMGSDGFIEAWDHWFMPADPPPDPLPMNTRGAPLEFEISSALSIEWIEVAMEIGEMTQDVSDNIRVLLVSPDGTQTDLLNYVREPAGLAPFITEDADDDSPFIWTFTTNRHWGERTDGVWKFVIENWSSEEIQVDDVEITFYGTRASTGRVQGIAGLDTNGDMNFNFTGLVDPATGEPVVDPSDPSIMAVPDPNREPLASEAIIYVDVDRDSRRDDDEPFWKTGADGNFHFDLPQGNYLIRVEAPLGTTVIGSDFRNVTISADAPRVTDLNFVFGVSPITFEGSVIADFDGDGTVDPREIGVSNFVLFADTNLNGQFDYNDLNFNFVFDPGIDEALEPTVVTGPGGEFSLVLDTTSPGFIGSGFYTLMLADREGWELTSPARPFYRMYAQAGDTIEDLDFLAEPDVSVVAGVVFNDLDQDGILDTTEPGLAGFTVFLDADNDGELGLGESSAVTTTTGSFAFTDIEPGPYVVRLIQVPAWKQLSPPNNGGYSFDLPADTLFPGRDFALTNLATHDFGDAPAPYPSTLAENGARHKVLAGFFLGSGIDGELGEGGGEGEVGDDDDGVEFVDGAEIEPGTAKTIVVTTSRAGGYLQAWIDFNRDGDWDDTGERVLTNQLLPPGATTLTISVPESVIGGATFARFRYGAFGIDSTRGEASMGEVEDYELEINAEPPHPADVNRDGVVSRDDGEVVRDNLGTTSGATHEMGDIDGDGDVDGNDLVQWMLGFGGGMAAGGASAAAPAALQESRSQDAGFAATFDFEQVELDGRVGAGPQERLSRARDAVRFELALERMGEAQLAQLELPRSPTSDGAYVAEQVPQFEGSRPAAKDAAITSFQNGRSKSAAAKPDSFADYAGRFAPAEVDTAIAAGLREEDNWLL
jgi:subtilisin family serine protease/subtilisin-like proprotein convertase family protein